MIRSSYILLRREKQLKYSECGTISPTKSRTFFLKSNITTYVYVFIHITTTPHVFVKNILLSNREIIIAHLGVEHKKRKKIQCFFFFFLS